MHIDLNRFHETFFEEVGEHLATLESVLLQLEHAPRDADLLNTLFRAAHSIKGASGTLGFADVAHFTHVLESLLDRLREGVIVATAELVEMLFASVDMLRGIVAAAQTGATPPADTEAFLVRLQQTFAVGNSSSPVSPLVTSPTPHAPQTYRLIFAPSRDLFRQRQDPLLLFRELGQQGETFDVVVDTTALPLLADMDPESCYFSWTLRIRTDQPAPVLRDVFVALENDNLITVTSETLDGGERDSFAVTGNEPFFGAYLVRRGFATPHQIIAALDQQYLNRWALGQLAIRNGKMTIKQVAATLQWMSDTEKRFGEVAVLLGFLTEEEVNQLLEVQRKTQPPLGNVLVSMGVLEREIMEAELAAFEAARGSSELPGTDAPMASPSCSAEPPAVPALLLENQEMLAEFLGEAQEHLDAADQWFVTLETDPGQRTAIDALYRSFHTIKGLAGFFGLEAIQTLAHAAEDLLNAARDGGSPLTGQGFDLAFASVDALKHQLQLVRNWMAGDGELLPDSQVAALVAALRELTALDGAPGNGPPTATKETPCPVRRTPAPPPPAGTTPEDRRSGEDRRFAVRRTADRVHKETVKVDRDRLDKLVNVIGELVIGAAMVEQEFLGGHGTKEGGTQALAQLGKTLRDLQELSLALRMVPIGSVFQKMARLCRDLAKKLGKQIQFETSGDDTELDKTVVDQIGDPLMHMVRNAADHGLETPAERRAAGKAEMGRLTLRAYHQGGNIYIEVEDDGRGLDRPAILKKAIERGLVREGEALSDQEIGNLIFLPGFSTAQEVTDVSGRGVGMDVVRRNVEALQGSIALRSDQGRGSTITVRLPLTLAILDGLSVSVGEEIFIVPLLSVVESLRPQASDLRRVVGQGEVVLVRGEIVPLIRLYHLLHLPARVHDPTRGLVVIVEDQGRKCALLVDELLGQQQVVIKNLEANYRKVEGMAGATILGDGRVALILDMFGLTRLAHRPPTPKGFTPDQPRELRHAPV